MLKFVKSNREIEQVIEINLATHATEEINGDF